MSKEKIERDYNHDMQLIHDAIGKMKFISPQSQQETKYQIIRLVNLCWSHMNHMTSHDMGLAERWESELNSLKSRFA